MTVEERALLDEATETLDLTISAFLRTLALRAARGLVMPDGGFLDGAER